MYEYAQNKVPASSSSKVVVLTDRQTDRPTDGKIRLGDTTEIITHPHSQRIIKCTHLTSMNPELSVSMASKTTSTFCLQDGGKHTF